MFTGNQMRACAVGAALLAGAVACSDSGPELAPSETRISIADGIIAHAATPLFYASVNGVLVPISPDTVVSLEVTFTDIAYLPVGDGEENLGAWETLTLDGPVTLDLYALPTEDAGSIVIGSGTVPVGSYHMVRLLAAEGEIVFKGPITVGNADFAANEPYVVTIPSGGQTGLKTDIAFEVMEGEDGTTNAVYLVFDPAATFENVTATGAGEVILTPVLRAKD